MRRPRINTGELTLVAEWEMDPAEWTTAGALSTIAEWVAAERGELLSIYNTGEGWTAVYTKDLPS